MKSQAIFMLVFFFLFSTFQKPGYKPECVDLCGARIEWTSEKSSRKNVFQVRGKAFLCSFESELCEKVGFISLVLITRA